MHCLRVRAVTVPVLGRIVLARKFIKIACTRRANILVSLRRADTAGLVSSTIFMKKLYVKLLWTMASSNSNIKSALMARDKFIHPPVTPNKSLKNSVSKLPDLKIYKRKNPTPNPHRKQQHRVLSYQLSDLLGSDSGGGVTVFNLRAILDTNFTGLVSRGVAF